MTIKIPASTIPVPNPLHNLASYSYALSLWWLDPADIAALGQCVDVDAAVNFKISDKSYVLAEDSGLYPDRRMPTTGGLNYYLQDVTIKTHIQPSVNTGNSNLLECTFTIKEPYGCSLMNAIVVQSAGKDYIQQPLMLQIEFFGYDDQGNQIPTTQTELYRKRYTITFADIKIKLDKGGTEYVVTAKPYNHGAYKEIHAKFPKAVTITAGTFGEFFTKLADEYNAHWRDQVSRGLAQYADELKFDIDPDIANSSIVNPDTMPLSRSSPNKHDVDFKKAPFPVTNGEDINAIIQRMFAECSFFVEDQLGLNLSKEQKNKNLATITNTFKTTVQAINQGITGSGAVVVGATERVSDIQQSRDAYQFTYKIHQYATIGGTHPLDTSALADSRPYTAKRYKYIYTGENIDIINFSADFNTSFYTAVLANNYNAAAAQVTADSANQNLAQYAPATGLALTPSFLINTILPDFKYTPILVPNRIHLITTNQNISSGHGGRAAAVTANDVLTAKQSADMLEVKLEIVGDPTLLKQDDWLYSPSPNLSPIYSGWDSMSQYEFATKYGHLRMDTQEVYIRLDINTPLDIDTEYLNSGLMYPPLGEDNTLTSLFSGQYKLLRITSTFSRGVFKQTLETARITNQEIPNAVPESTDATSISQKNQRESNSTNSTNTTNNTPAGSSKAVSETPVQNTADNPFATSNVSKVDVNNPVVIAPTTPTLNNTDGFKARQ
jgi:hypothetical protein